MLIDEYKALSSRNDFFIDPEQQKTINSFQELYNRILGIRNPGDSILGNIGVNLFRKSGNQKNKGIYLYGGVGRGKTFLMDMFFKELPIKKKKRIHFHRFMNNIHSKLNDKKDTVNPIDEIAKEISLDTDVLCFDEFIVNHNFNDKFPLLERKFKKEINKYGFSVDYIAIRSSIDLSLPEDGCKNLIILVSVLIDNVRLIDNEKI